MESRTAVALIRFGLGRRGGEPLPADPAGWLAAQLDAADPGCASASAAEGLAALYAVRREQRAGGHPTRTRDLFRADAAAAAALLLETPTPFRERLVWFWANHFTVSRRHGGLEALCFPFVQQAIRPHVTGRFSDMLLAVARHPAMLIYLDAARSIGPDSPAGLRTHRGLNENFARECLELHTLGRDAGYTQADVTAFAALFTGWGLGREDAAPGFAYFPRRHQPGAATLMGHTWPDGEAGGVAALRWLGTHPATCRRLAEKLVRHFVADAPPPETVGHVASALRAGGGDLRAAALALLDLPQAWQTDGKLRTPFDYAVAALRALDLPAERRPDLTAVLARLGQPWMAAPLPDGWPDTAADWADGEMLLRRADWSSAIAGRADGVDPMALAQAALGPCLGAPTALALGRAASRREALALLLASPEFQRR